MPEEPRATPEHTPDASDVVEGPVGSASLRNPATPGSSGADLGALRPIDIDPGTSDDGGSIESPAVPEERQDRDHVGVDWELIQRDRD